MTQQPTKHPIRRGRIFPEHTIPPEELARRETERKERYQHCRPVFERVRDELIANHYNWFMIIEPDSSEYFIDLNEDVAIHKARQKYSRGTLVIFRINETGACGMI
ncbi:hypothetical protein F7734_23990 [Scytonema sp. UIC 10036]|uniref:hypothetical protein n=1 Tax=Scytonema sp. UIC 10036 TaxID=2304196 RepID=UPI0012DA03FA|nr:hypothetical protein [Scytonema sp. UIC 10036]MUG95255.1 hypothetical protein [Scytonema sp. UIC 10036]